MPLLILRDMRQAKNGERETHVFERKETQQEKTKNENKKILIRTKYRRRARNDQRWVRETEKRDEGTSHQQGTKTRTTYNHLSFYRIRFFFFFLFFDDGHHELLFWCLLTFFSFLILWRMKRAVYIDRTIWTYWFDICFSVGTNFFPSGICRCARSGLRDICINKEV